MSSRQHRGTKRGEKKTTTPLNLILFDLSPCNQKDGIDTNEDVLKRMMECISRARTTGDKLKIFSSYADDSTKELAEFPEVKNLWMRAGKEYGLLQYYLDNLPETRIELKTLIIIACGEIIGKDYRNQELNIGVDRRRLSTLFENANIERALPYLNSVFD